MKIIKIGSIPADKIYTCTCKYCKTQVELTLKDQEVTYYNDQRDGPYFTYPCPLCITINYGIP